MDSIPDSLRRYGDLVSSPGSFYSCSRAPLPVTGWFNPCKSDLARRWMAEERSNMSWCPDGFRVNETLTPAFLTGFLSGSLLIQEESAMTSVGLMDVRPGQRILDLCAAPGNKTAQISTLLGDTGMVVANDLSRARLGVVLGTIDRMGLANVVTTAYDARHFPVPDQLFDSVLADVPCTCEGTSRKHPEILFKDNDSERARLVRIQKEILTRAIQCVRPGGLVVYSTCTYAPEENEHVVNHVLQNGAPDWEVRLEPIAIPGLKMSPGLENWNGEHFDSTITRCARIWPHENDTGGFFLAVLRRKGGSETGEKVRGSGTEAGDASPVGDAGMSPNASFVAIQPDEWPWVAHDFHADDLAAWRRAPFSKKYDRLIGAGCHLPPGLAVHSLGMTGLNLKSDYPKFSTALALKLGHLSHAGKAHLCDDDILPFFRRESVHPEDFVSPKVDSNTVLVHSHGLTLGLGSIESSGAISSRFPKVWGGLEVSDRIDLILKRG